MSTYEPVGPPDDGDVERVPVWSGTMDGMVDVPLTLVLDRDWAIESVEAASEAMIDFTP